jgi:hypothetical protein
MDLTHFEARSPLLGTGKDLPHLAGPGAALRQVLAAHFVRECPNVIEIGGHIRPITPYLTHRPRSVLVADPKAEPFEAEELNGAPCRVRHVARKFQEIRYDYQDRSFGLVMLGYSLKPFGAHEPLNGLLFSLIDHAKLVVVEYPPALERAASQVPRLLDREGVRVLCSFELLLEDPELSDTPYARRRFVVFRQEAAPRPRAN